MKLRRGAGLALEERELRKGGGYTPPDGDPRKCEPTLPATLAGETKGGFDHRIEHKALSPFDRCGRICCQVQDACTRSVQEEIAANSE